MSRTYKSVKQMQIFIALGFLLAACGGGWQTLEGDGFSITLPASYLGGSDSASFAEVAAMYREAGKENLAQSVEANTAAGFILLYAADKEVNNDSNTFTNVNVVREQNPVLADYTIQEYVDLSLAQLQSLAGITVVDQGEVTIPGFEEAYWLVEQYDLSLLLGEEGISKADQYLMKSGDTVWVITYVTDSSEYEARHAEFETSVKSFVQK